MKDIGMNRVPSERPKVSIGLPVFNGERYLREALESLVTQTYEDLEVIVCDNRSTDGTEQIVRAVAERDPRVRYVRNTANIGGPRNFNRSFELASGEYFKWMAHDDVCRPDFIRRCVEVLDRDASVVLAYPSPLDIDQHGRPIGPRDAHLDFTKERPFERFRDQMIKAHAALPFYGLIRSDVLRRTGLHGSYPGADRVLLAELALYGKFHEVPEQLFLHREHRERGTYCRSARQKLIVWHDPDLAGRISFPTWRLLGGYLYAAARAPVSWRDKARCLVQMAGWCKGKRRELARDLTYAAGILRSQWTGWPQPTGQ